MKEIAIIKEQVYNQGLSTLLKRLEILIPEYRIKRLIEPIVVSAEIVNIEEIVKTIKSIYTCFGIKDIRVSLEDQVIYFKVYGSCYIPEKYKSYRLFSDEWSATQTDKYNYLKVIKEEYAEEMFMPIGSFTNGIKVEIV